MMTVGLIDAGRSVFLYNELSSVARFGARWGSVVGGSCAAPLGRSTSDWCNQLSSTTGNFWSQSGNDPLQGYGTECPNYTSTPSDWYTAGSYSGPTATTIVGAVAKKFDTDASRSSFFSQIFGPGVDLSQLQVCIETTNSSGSPSPGDSITVDVYYPFVPAGKLLGTGTYPITAEAQYVVE
jgi:hypothetical protein